MGFEVLEHVPRELAGEFQVIEFPVPPEHARGLAAGQHHAGLRLEPLAGAGVHQRRLGAEHALEQQLDPSAAVLGSVNARRNHPGIVEHQKIVRPQKRREIPKAEVAACPGAALQLQAGGWRSAARSAAGR